MEKKKYYRRIFGYFKNEKVKIFFYLITAILVVIISSLEPLISAKNLEAITSVNLSLMSKFALLLMFISIMSYLINYINIDLSRKIQRKVEIKIKEDVSKELFDLKLKNFDQEGTGFFANRIENEPRSLASIFSQIRYSVTGFFTALGIYIYIFYVCPIIGIYLLIVSLIRFLISYRRIKKWEEEEKQSNLMREKYSSNFGELIRGIRDIKVLNLKNYLIKKTVKEQKELILFNEEIDRKDRFVDFGYNIINIVADFIFVIIGIVLIKNSLLSGATFLVLYMYRGRAGYVLDEIKYVYKSIKEFNLSLERLYEIIDNTKYSKEVFGNINLKNIQGKIEFQNVNFGYDENPVIKNVSFKIEPHETIGIVGKSGAGKSTIINLINKLYDVEDGKILIDNTNINELTEKSLRENISTITQNPYIFNMSIKDNLKIVNDNISDKEIEEKCELCALSNYIETLDKKYDTLVGENGVILSGGLKQRLAIARAILKQSKIIMLDEATSSLDNETQDYIHHSIKRIRNDYTIIIIAHRLSTVIDCDKILVIDDGQVVGFDTHENLIKNNKIYQKLYKKELI